MRNAAGRGRAGGKRRQAPHHPIPAPPLWPQNEWWLTQRPFSDDVSALLWLRARSTRLWATSQESARHELFSRASAEFVSWEEEIAEQFPEIAPHLRTLGAVVRYPDLIHSAPVASACSAISSWADEAGSLAVALEYAEVAALTTPEAPKPAADAGHLSTRAAAYDRAWLWLTRSVMLARRARDWEWYVRSHIRLGIMLYELGQHAKARPHYWRATQAALYSGRRTLAGKAQHDLLLIEAESGNYVSGEKCARSVLEYYPRVYERIPHFVHDYAYLLVRHGYFRPALPLAEAALSWIEKPYERIAVLATIARAAAGVRERTKYDEAASELLCISEETEVNAAAALIALAEGAAAWGEWNDAKLLAERAREIAERRREGDPLRRTLNLLVKIERKEAPDEAIQAPPANARIQETAAACLRRLHRQHAPKRGSTAKRVVTAGMAISTASSP